MISPANNIVSAAWLNQQLSDAVLAASIVVLDASAFMPDVPRDPKQEFIDVRIPTAQFFDFNHQIAAPNTDLPHMLPPADLFTAEVATLGVNNTSHVVIYDSQGMFSAPRGWWMFKAMGHDNVSVLDGGLPAWLAAGYATQTGEPVAIENGDFCAKFRPNWVIDADTLCQKLDDKQVQIIDARPSARFFATVKEPRAGIRSGHMPNAKNLPFGNVLVNGYFLATEQLKQQFDALSNNQQRLIFSCGSGVTACILALAAQQAGRDNVTVYDGSWTEWGANDNYPVVK
ncbi:thiosulfate sulfurtransferase [Photobacterium aquimaris]|uniref:sulfurtransferase n=1 Tax=Photobacterium aquimaris TaxID=512643 RepID=UPI0007F010D2|nr:rhodanese-like domain-containing protein [Photobacterium aquimaris]OBU16303.1 thiosulfate sulfurtransferase [Photobacterium aquimaris]PSW02291.1 sulfurtransferase [Photobacterium aquimaris]